LRQRRLLRACGRVWRQSVRRLWQCLRRHNRRRRVRTGRLRVGCGNLRRRGRSVLWHHLYGRTCCVCGWRRLRELCRLWRCWRALLRNYRKPQLYRRRHGLQRRHGCVYLRNLRRDWAALLWRHRGNADLHGRQFGLRCDRWRGRWNCNLRGLWGRRQCLLRRQRVQRRWLLRPQRHLHSRRCRLSQQQWRVPGWGMCR
jgi:hypothetical protein